MKNLKISAKLLVSFLIITAFSVVLAGVGIYANYSINRNYTYFLEKPLDRVDLLKEMQFQFTMMRYRTANYAMEVNNPDIITGTLTPQYEQAYTAFKAALTAYKENNSSDSKRDPAIIRQNSDNADKLSGLVESFKATSENTRTIALSGEYDAATTSLRDAIPLATEINTLFADMLAPADEYVQSQSESMDSFAVVLAIVQISLSVVCVVLSVVLSVYIAGIIGKPIRFMKDILSKMGRRGIIHLSEYDAQQAEGYAAYRDEIAESIQMLIETGRRLDTVGHALERIADGDLTAEISLLSGEDAMGKSLQKMAESLNNMFRNINQSTAQVSTGAKQIADGSQSLAQGTSEQAAAVEQLSSAISEIAQMTGDNASMADEAAQLAGRIKDNAEKGSRQMDEMMSAVGEINQASQSINKVMKVIDDIAFQTNILALNAAVEAARAGQHGKGFAVVAEEVRNLAAKSAAAAKDTGALITNSIEKAELGAKIADETAASLAEIVSGINESSRIVSEIAKSSGEQSVGIEEINKGINQVAQVVQQNSASSEQSAAASEEMSSQAAILEELVAQYKLKDAHRLSGEPRQLLLP